jgi:hypothetical protein
VSPPEIDDGAALARRTLDRDTTRVRHLDPDATDPHATRLESP